jgi:lipoprotein-releasing system permease protein
MKPGTVLKFAWRYFRAKKSTQAINIISWVSVSAIIFGTASLITILSAFNGFESLVKSLYSSFYADVKISPQKGKVILLGTVQLEQLRALPGVRAVSLAVEEKALLQYGETQTVVHLKGVDDVYTSVVGLPSNMYRGEFNTGTPEQPGLVLGVGIEQSLGLLSDRSMYPVSVYLPRRNAQSSIDPLSALGVAVGFPTGSFAIQSEFDNKYVITNLAFIRDHLSMQENEFGSAEIKLLPGVNAVEVVQAIKSLLGKGYIVQDRFEQNRMLYTTIQLEKLAIYGIFSLILIVAAFNMVGALSMLVLEKKKDIQVMMAMGADNILIQKIFIAEGMLLAMLGALGGILLAFLLYFLQTRFKLIPLQGTTFLIDYYPIKLVLTDFVLVLSTVLAIGFAASWFPSKRAAAALMELRS